MQEEYELELMDYLRVIWWGKWIILACFALAVGGAAAVIWTKAPTYSVAGLYEVRETLSLYAASQNATALAKNAVQALPDLDALGLERAVSQKDPSFVGVSISGRGSPTEMESALASSIAALEAALVAQAEQALARERARAEADSGRLTAQVALLRERLAAEKGEAAREALAAQVAKLETQVAEAAVRRDELVYLAPARLVTLHEISRSAVGEVGRSAKMTLAVAGFLGLFLGVLLAFFVHYVVTYTRGKGTREHT